MNWRRFKLLAVAIALTWFAPSGRIWADQQEELRHYRFVPKYSELTQGWRDREAPDILVPISGTFDFVTGWDKPDDHWTGQYARFENVDAGGPHPIQDVIVDLDEALNLSGLAGRQLPVAGPFDMFEFLGKNSVGHDVHLIATLIGPWLRLNGETTPTLGSADPRYYAILAVARQLPSADFNGDAVVDGADVAAWSERFGSADVFDGTNYADADGDGDTDGGDLLAWQRILGEAAPGASPAPMTSGGAVPEPTTAVLALVAMAMLGRAAMAWSWRSTRRRSGGAALC